MPEVYAGRAHEFSDEVRKVVEVDRREVAVLRWNGGFYAIANTCFHMGGPVGEGVIMGRVRAVLDDQQCLVREEFSEDELQIVCPWHGWAYDLESGAFAGDERLRLPTYDVEVRDGEVYVVT